MFCDMVRDKKIENIAKDFATAAAVISNMSCVVVSKRQFHNTIDCAFYFVIKHISSCTRVSNNMILCSIVITD